MERARKGRHGRAASGGRGAAWAAWLLVAWVAGCGSSAAVFPTAGELPDEERRPDGVAVDRLGRAPAAQDRATTDDGVVSLRAPLGLDVAHRAIRQFFSAVARESTAALAETLRSGAMVQDTRPGRPGQAASTELRPVLGWWQERFRKVDYGLLVGRSAYREADIQTYRAAQLDALPASLRHSLRHVPEPFRGTDLLLRVPILTPTVGAERLLGREMAFWLRPQGDRFVIYHIAEPFPF